MTCVFVEVRKALKSGGNAFFVVGNNHTVAGGERVEIRTASLLQDIARRAGFEVGQPLSMEMQRLIELRARTNENEYLFRCKLDAQPMLEEAFVRGKRA